MMLYVHLSKLFGTFCTPIIFKPVLMRGPQCIVDLVSCIGSYFSSIVLQFPCACEYGLYKSPRQKY